MSYEAQSSEYDQELDNHLLDFVDQEENDEANVQTVKPRGRGRPRLPEKWTRVFNVDTINAEGPRTYEISRDLLLASGMRNEPNSSN